MSETENTVIVCMDGSEHSKYALKYYAENVHKPDNKVIVVHCSQYVSFNYGNVSVVSFSPSMVEKIISEEEERVKDMTNGVEKQLSDLGITNGVIERLQGDVGHEIIERAKATGASMIITGARGMGKFRRTLLGSVSDYLVHHSPIPVFVCKHPNTQEKHETTQ